MDSETKTYTIQKLSNNICFLKIKGIGKPYTTLKDICKITLKNSDKIDKIKVYNLLSKKIENIFFSEIEEITIHGEEGDNIEISLSYINKINSDLEDCSLEYISKDELEEYYLKNEVYLVNSEKDIFNICKKFEFTVRDYEIRGNTISNIHNIKNVWNKIIKIKVDENVNELNEIKDEAGDEDVEDINSIIEMFNETLNEIDLSDCKNLFDIIDTYPPLLLPLPDELRSIKNKINSNNDNTLDSALSLIETMTFNELQEIYNEVSEIKDTNYVVTKVIDKIKEILDKLNQ